MAAEFDLVTEWRLDAPAERVWALLRDVEGWPSWWPCLASATCLDRGAGDGIGAVHRLCWTTALPYRLAFDIRLVAVEPMRRIEAEATGELDGRGTWAFSPEAERTRLRYRWQVRPGKAWMRRLAPLLRPIFAWNHGVVMRRGLRGLQARLRDYSLCPSPPSASSSLAAPSSPSALLTK